MQRISFLTLVVNDQCNFSCPYCPQRKGENELSFDDIRRFLDFLTPKLSGKARLAFYGGEPLLSWTLIEKVAAHAEKKYEGRFHFVLTTNGSLMNEERLLFFKKHRFDLALSYDGLAQEHRDASSVASVEAALENLRRLYPAGYLVHSVFTPRTVSLLSASIEALMERGHRRLQVALDQIAPWQNADLAALEQQLSRLETACSENRRKTGTMPLENFKKNDKKGVFACSAGSDRLALLPDRTVWGCEIFHTLLGHDTGNPDYARYCFGNLDEFLSMSERMRASIAARYSELRQDLFLTETKELCALCALCADLERCAVCPAAAALATGIPGMIPSWTCRIQKLTRAVSAGFT